MGEMEDLCVTDCTRCPALVDSRSRIVNGAGPEDADLLFVGEGLVPRKTSRANRSWPQRYRPGRRAPEPSASHAVISVSATACAVARRRTAIRRKTNSRTVGGTSSGDRSPRSRGDRHARRFQANTSSERSVAVTKEAGDLEEIRIDGTPRRLLICVHPAATLYDRSQEETFENALERAADLAGVADSEGGQSRLDGF